MFTSPTNKAAYLMIGGFLGAGKTTHIGQFAKFLAEQGRRVGLITNDQAGGLVDTRILRSKGFSTEEIAGGCFCCRFDSLVKAASQLSEQEVPEYFIAEPVGSCTDLVATVSYPLRRLYGDNYRIAPLSVLVDPVRAMRALGLSDAAGFSSKVTYIFKKQLEEADIIVVTKIDTLESAQLEALQAELQRQFPHAQLHATSAVTGEGLDAWFQAVLNQEQSSHRSLSIDYDTYADGEALLGWLNATVRLESADEFEARDLLLELALAIRNSLAERQAEIGHFKMTYSPDESFNGELASVNVTRIDDEPRIGLDLEEPSESGQLIINLRAECDPEILKTLTAEALDTLQTAHPELRVTWEHEEHFRPGRPTPTHRDEVEV